MSAENRPSRIKGIRKAAVVAGLGAVALFGCTQEKTPAQITVSPTPTAIENAITETKTRKNNDDLILDGLVVLSILVSGGIALALADGVNDNVKTIK